MNYNTLKASYPTVRPYPKEELGLVGKDCKELGVSPGDGTNAGYRISGLPPKPIKGMNYSDIKAYPFTDTEKWLNEGGRCLGTSEKWLCELTFWECYRPIRSHMCNWQPINSVSIYRCADNSASCGYEDSSSTSKLPTCLQWFGGSRGYIISGSNAAKITQKCKPCTPFNPPIPGTVTCPTP